MSDVTNDVNVDVEQLNQEKLANLWKALLINVGVSGIGWVICYLCIGNALRNDFFVLVGALLVAGPVLVKYWESKSILGMFKMSEYEVVTTTKDGSGNVISKTSDGGYQSATTNLFGMVILMVALLLLACAIQPIRIIILGIKYAATYAKVKVKPALIHNGFAVLGLGLILFLIPVPLESVVNNALYGDKSDFSKLNAVGNTIIAKYDPTKLYEKADDESNALLEIPSGTRLTIADKAANDPSGKSRYYLPVEYEGKKGWVSNLDIFYVAGTATVVADTSLSVAAGSRYDQRPDFAVDGDGVGRITIKQGTTVNIGSYSRPFAGNYSYGIEYDGVFSSLPPDLLNVSNETKKLLGVK